MQFFGLFLLLLIIHAADLVSLLFPVPDLARITIAGTDRIIAHIFIMRP